MQLAIFFTFRWALRIISGTILGIGIILHLLGFGSLQYLWESNILFYAIIVLLFSFSRRSLGKFRSILSGIALGVFILAVALQVMGAIIPLTDGGESGILQWLWNSKWFFAPCLLFPLTFIGRGKKEIVVVKEGAQRKEGMIR